MQIIAAGCCFLAAKVEESFRKPDDIANQFFILHPNNDLSSIPVGAFQCIYPQEVKMKILLAERIILNVLSFDLIVEQPYSTMMVLAQQLQRFPSSLYSFIVNEKALQAAWRFANDS